MRCERSSGSVTEIDMSYVGAPNAPPEVDQIRSV